MTPLKFIFERALFLAITGLATAAAMSLAGCKDKDQGNDPNPGEVRSQLIDGPSGELFVSDGGRGGLPVVFVHSFAGSSEHWKEQLAHLRTDRRALALDLRGNGQSDEPDNDDYSIDAFATDIEAVVDAKGLDRFVLVGHSMGGSAAALFAGTHADRVAGLMLVGTPGKAAPEKVDQIMAMLASDYEKTMDGYWQSLVDGAKPQNADMLITEGKNVERDASIAMIDATFAYDPLPSLAAYRGPKLLVDTPHGDGPDALHNEMPALPRVVIEGTSHWPQLDKPTEFNAILDEFLKDVAAAE